MARRIGVDEWLAELNRVTKDQPEGFSRRDVQGTLSLSVERANRLLRDWFDRGMIYHAGNRLGMSMDGKAHKVPVYLPVKAATKAKRPPASRR